MYFKRDTPGSTLEDALRSMHPDYLLLDSFVLDAALDDAQAARQNPTFLTIKKSELDAFLAKYTTFTSIQSQTYGEIRIYKIDWAGHGSSLLPLRPEGNHSWKPL